MTYKPLTELTQDDVEKEIIEPLEKKVFNPLTWNCVDQNGVIQKQFSDSFYCMVGDRDLICPYLDTTKCVFFKDKRYEAKFYGCSYVKK